jgi:hypothetical protein
VRLWPRVKSNAGSPDVERCEHVKSWATTVYFRLGRLRRVSTYVQHVWGIIGNVTVEVGNTEGTGTVGTDGTPPQYFRFGIVDIPTHCRKYGASCFWCWGKLVQTVVDENELSVWRTFYCRKILYQRAKHMLKSLEKNHKISCCFTDFLNDMVFRKYALPFA